MGIIEIEWDIGKDRGVRILFSLIDKLIYYSARYSSIYKKNYLKLIAKRKNPSFFKTDFRKRLYPFIFFWIIAPVVFGISFNKYIPEDVLLASSIIYAFILGTIFVIALIYFVYRLIIDLWITGVCSLRSFIRTNIYSFKKLINIFNRFLLVFRKNRNT
jgi:hypothetical protein